MRGTLIGDVACSFWDALNVMLLTAKTVYDAYDWWTLAAQWGSAIGTIAAVVVSLRLAFADRARTRQAAERAEDELRRTREAAARAQAEQITVWLNRAPDAGRGDVMVSNASSSAVYDVVIGYGAAYGGGGTFLKGNRENNDNLLFINRLAPGLWSVAGAKGFPGGGMHVLPEAAMAFRDAAGRFWVRDARGELEQVDEHPYTYANAFQPISPWAQTTRVVG